MALTRIYPIPPVTPLLANLRNARSTVPEIGLPSTTAFMEVWRKRIVRYITPLYAGLRQPVLSVAEYTEHALVSTAAVLDTCTAESDDALYAWVSSQATTAVLELHAATRGAAPRLQRRATRAAAAGRAA